ncbi:tol-pal system YbgF family protein [Thermodesulfobacteriota bacterium]
MALPAFCGPANATPAFYIDAESQYDYAAALFDQGNFAAAAVEYRRFLHFFPDEPLVVNAMYQIGLCLFHDRKFKEAIDAFQNVIDAFEDSRQAMWSYFKISEAHLAQRDFGSAVLALQNLLTANPEVDVADRAHYHMGWIFVELAEWDRARSQFARISESNRMKYNLQQLLDELDQEKQIKRKSPRLAGFLSIIPGGGFAYTERYQDALVAFLVNGAMIWAAYEAFDNDLPALGTCITVVGFGFYAGNIYGGVSSAHKFNDRQTQSFVEQLKENTRISLGVDPQGGVAFLINYRY